MRVLYCSRHQFRVIIRDRNKLLVSEDRNGGGAGGGGSEGRGFVVCSFSSKLGEKEGAFH